MSHLTPEAKDRLLRGEWVPTEAQQYDIRIHATTRVGGIQLHAVLHGADGTPLIDLGPALVSDGATFTICGLKVTFDAMTLEEDWRRWRKQVTVYLEAFR